MTDVTRAAIRRSTTCLLAVLWCMGAAAALAQDRFATVDYMKVAPGGDDAYLQLEKTWRPVHEARIKAGKAAGWYLYRVLSPSGSEVHHNYVTVAIYDNLEAVENPFPAELFAQVHPGVSMADIGKRTDSARDLVRSETWQWMARIPDATLATPAPYLNVESMRVPPGGDAEYAEVERLWRKIHDVRIKDGTLSHWDLLTRVFPGGSDYPFSYVTVNGYNRFKDVHGLDLESVVPRATLGMSANDLGDKTAKARDLARAELWLLVDYVQAPAR